MLVWKVCLSDSAVVSQQASRGCFLDPCRLNNEIRHNKWNQRIQNKSKSEPDFPDTYIHRDY